MPLQADSGTAIMDKRDLGLPPPTLSPVKETTSMAAASSVRQPIFPSDQEMPSPETSGMPPTLRLDAKLSFQYHGDLFGQHGVYSDANVYMSRLPSSRKGAILRPKAGAAYVKLAPMEYSPPASSTSAVIHQRPPQLEREKPSGGASTKPHKVSRKRQYAIAIEAMASAAALRTSLLSDNVIPNLLSLLRTKDTTTLASCVATLCFLSNDALGREAILKHSAVPVLTGISLPVPLSLHSADATSRQTLIHNYVATLANLTIEDASESVVVREKALESILKHRKTSAMSERMCVFSILNLSAPTFSYPRVDAVVHAIHELTREPVLSTDHREILSQALYNLSCTKLNQPKLVDGDVVSVLRKLIVLRDNVLSEVSDATDASHVRVDATRLNALMAIWHLSENPLCRRALTKADCTRALVETLRSSTAVSDRLTCALLVMVNLASDDIARQRLSSAGTLDVLAELVTRFSDGTHTELVAVVYRLIALILSAPAAVEDVRPSFLAFLLGCHVDDQAMREYCARYVLFALVSIFSWSDSDEGDRRLPSKVRSPTTIETVVGTYPRSHVDELLDNPAHFDPLLTHVQAVGFASDDAPEVLLQMLLLHNLSFRYNKVEIARRAAPRLKTLAHASTSGTIINVVCSTLFSLCQEYATHRELHAAGMLQVLPELIQHCSHDPTTQMLCLDVVCIVFDGRMLLRSDLVALMTLVAPALVTLCEAGSTALRASCAACFARFASIDECQPALGHHGVIRALSILANEEDTQTLRLCVSAYSHLSRDAAICAQLINSGIIKSLTFLAAAPEEAVRRACAMTLCNLSTSEENVGALAKAGALKALLVISCVKSNDPETRRICMKAVMNLLRLAAAIPQLCQDGLIWAFGLFTTGMEPKDYDILCDAFGALAFYPATRKGIAKPAIFVSMFKILTSQSVTLGTTIKLLKGVSNILCDLPHATLLIHADVLPHLVAIVDRTHHDGSLGQEEAETRTLVAQVLVLIFQSCPDAENEFAEPAMLRTIATLLGTDHDDCGRCCSILLYQMSLHSVTRTRLVLGVDGSDSPTASSLVAFLPALFLRVMRDTQSLLVRLLYNVSCDTPLNRQLCVVDVVTCVLATMPKKIAALAIDVAAFCAGLLRNLSCEASSHLTLVAEPSTGLLQRLFDVDDDTTKEDVAVCVCNVFMGRVNSSALLARGVLPIVLWLCSSRATPESRALGTTVVRKLALAPGNAQALVDGGVISHLALLMQDSKSLFVEINSIATFCCVARKPGVPALLASYGVITSVLELLEAQHVSDPLFEAMCADLLSALAEFVRADDPVESKLASILYRLIENNDSAAPTPPVLTASTWQTDRAFLARDASSPLSPPTLSSAHRRVAAKPPLLRHTLYPIRFAGYAVEMPSMTSTIEVRTIEPIVPSLVIIGEAVAADVTSLVAVAVAESSSSHDRVPPSCFAFSPLAMFAKQRTPFAAMPSMPADQHRQPL